MLDNEQHQLAQLSKIMQRIIDPDGVETVQAINTFRARIAATKIRWTELRLTTVNLASLEERATRLNAILFPTDNPTQELEKEVARLKSELEVKDMQIKQHKQTNSELSEQNSTLSEKELTLIGSSANQAEELAKAVEDVITTLTSGEQWHPAALAGILESALSFFRAAADRERELPPGKYITKSGRKRKSEGRLSTPEAYQLACRLRIDEQRSAAETAEVMGFGYYEGGPHHGKPLTGVIDGTFNNQAPNETLLGHTIEIIDKKRMDFYELWKIGFAIYGPKWRDALGTRFKIKVVISCHPPSNFFSQAEMDQLRKEYRALQKRQYL